MAVTSLGEALRAFYRRPSPRLLAAAASLGLALRLALGPLAVRDAVLAATITLAQPFLEWLVHLHVLHARPFTVLGRVVDVGRSHRVHHDDPRDPAHIFVDVRFLGAALVLVAGLWVVAFRGDALLLGTALVVAPARVLAYEWTHYLVHTDYAGRTAFYRHLRRSHLLHHYRNERYWLGVTSPVADVLLRTAPRPAATPRVRVGTNVRAG